VDLFLWHKSVLVSNPSKFEQASDLVRKIFTSSRLLPLLMSPKGGVDIDRLILESLHPSISSVEIKHVGLRASRDDNRLIFESWAGL
jgi:hypothetical protein